MRILVISDIHSNLEALKEVFWFLKKNRIEIQKIFLLGDIVGYGPQPEECINFFKNLSGVEGIAGNHDAGVTERIDIYDFRSDAKEVIKWTRSILTQDNYNYILNLPEKLIVNAEKMKVLLVHGSPSEPLREYLLSPFQIEKNLKEFNETICFFGHTHIPAVAISKDNKLLEYKTLIENGYTVKIEKGKKYMINPGSVGQPRDRNPQASFGILDTEKMNFKFYRIDYNFRLTQNLIRKYELPGFFADRLAWGV